MCIDESNAWRRVQLRVPVPVRAAAAEERSSVSERRDATRHSTRKQLNSSGQSAVACDYQRWERSNERHYEMHWTAQRCTVQSGWTRVESNRIASHRNGPTAAAVQASGELMLLYCTRYVDSYAYCTVLRGGPRPPRACINHQSGRSAVECHSTASRSMLPHWHGTAQRSTERREREYGTGGADGHRNGGRGGTGQKRTGEAGCAERCVEWAA